MIHRTIIKIIILCFTLFGIAQVVEAQKTDKNNWNISGYLSAGADAYTISGFKNRRSPFSYYTRGGMSLSYKNFSLPVNISYSDQQYSYGYALNRIGITPTYKWIKGHIGWSSMQFSSYVMNRKQFLGVGLELSPGKFKAAGFYGSLANPRAIRDTILYGAVLLPSFKRNAMGMKIGYGTYKNSFELSLFNAQDDLNSIVNRSDQFLPAVPEDNLVIGTKFRISPWRFISLETNVAASATTNNKLSDDIEFEQEKLISSFLQPKTSTQASFAGDAKLRVNLKRQSFGVEYKRIEPRFRSFGLPFMQTDIQSYLGYTNINLFKSKLNLNLQGGFQSNNLRKIRAVQTTRLVSNVQASIKASKTVFINARWSNFTNNTEPGITELNDTLRFTMASESAGLMFRFNSKQKTNKWRTTLNITRQTVQDLSPVQRITGDIENWQSNLSISKSLDDSNFKVKGSILYSAYTGQYGDQTRYGGNVGIDKALFDKALKMGFNTRYFRNDVGDKSNGFVVTSRLTISYSITKSQSINLRTLFIKKSAPVGRSFNELRSGISYSIRL